MSLSARCERLRRFALVRRLQVSALATCVLGLPTAALAGYLSEADRWLSLQTPPQPIMIALALRGLGICFGVTGREPLLQFVRGQTEGRRLVGERFAVDSILAHAAGPSSI